MTLTAGCKKKRCLERKWRTDNGHRGSIIANKMGKHYKDRITDSPKCRMCGKLDENVSHILLECNELA